MFPTLRGGEFVLVNPAETATVGDVIVVRHPTQDLVLIKRLSPDPHDDDRLWVLSDNAAEGTDSRRFGPVGPDSIVGVVTLVLNRPLGSLTSSGAVCRRS